MSPAGSVRAYRFATPAQWRAGLVDGLDPVSDGFALPAAYAAETVFDKRPATAPLADPDGVLRWLRVEDGASLALDPCFMPRQPRHQPALVGFTLTPRQVASGGQLWAFDPASRRVGRFALPSLQSLGEPLELGRYGRLVDIAAAPEGCLAVLLVPEREPARVLTLDRGGRLCRKVETGPLPGDADGLALLHHGAAAAVLANGGNSLHLLHLREGQVVRRLALTLDPAFDLIAGDGAERLLLARRIDGTWWLLDAEGSLRAQGRTKTRLRGVALVHDGLLLAGDGGLTRLAAAPGVGAEGGFLSPTLRSPPTNQNHWRAIEIEADLPPGTGLQVDRASTGDPVLARAVDGILADPGLAAEEKRRRAEHLLSFTCGFLIAGDDNRPDPCRPDAPPTAFWRLPLNDAPEPFLWVRLRLTRRASPHPPRLRGVRILYPDGGLIEQLPAIYRASAETRPFLRRYLAVFEGTSASLDASRRAIADRLGSAGTPAAWLDWLAAWQDLPWAGRLDEATKRRLLVRAGPILAAKGTRAALNMVLACLFPRGGYRLRDPGAEMGPARLGTVALGRGLLAGETPVVLGRSALCRRRLAPLPGPGRGDPPWLGLVLVDVPDDGLDLTRNDLQALLDDLLPAGARIRLRRRPPAAGASLDRDLHLPAPGRERLGRDLVLGRSAIRAGAPHPLLPEGGAALPLPLA